MNIDELNALKARAEKIEEIINARLDCVWGNQNQAFRTIRDADSAFQIIQQVTRIVRTVTRAKRYALMLSGHVFDDLRYASLTLDELEDSYII